MAKAKKHAKKKRGPYLAAAFFCETLMEDAKDGAWSAIRIIDSITMTLHPSTPPEVPSEKHRIPIAVSGLISFKTGDFPGEHTVRLDMESPSGKREKVLEQSVPFTPPPYGGANIRLNSVIAAKKGGLFWMHIFLDGKRVTSMPLMITIQRAEAPPAPTATTQGAQPANKPAPPA